MREPGLLKAGAACTAAGPGPEPTPPLRRTVDTLAGVLTGLLWPGAAPRGGGIPAATSSHLDEVLWGNAVNCERLRAVFKSHSRRVRGARPPPVMP